MDALAFSTANFFLVYSLEHVLCMQLPQSTPFEEFGGLVGEIPHKAFSAWAGVSEQKKLFQALTDFS